MKKSIFALMLLLLSFVTGVSAEKVWTMADTLKNKGIGGTSLSPDGKWVAYTVSEKFMGEETSEYSTHIWITALDGSRTYRLTRGKNSCRGPRWSPQGNRIAFVSSRQTGAMNIWIIPFDGGEALRLTDLEEGVSSFRWSPDGSHIAFLMRDPKTEEEKEAERTKTDVRIVNRRWFRYNHIYTVPVPRYITKPQKIKKITGGDIQITSLNWSPDGKRFAFTHQPTTKEVDWRNSDISSIPAQGGEISPLVVSPGMDNEPLYSPDGKWVAFVSDRGNRSWGRDFRICAVPAAGGKVKTLPRTFDSLPGDIMGTLLCWSTDSKKIFYDENTGVDVQVFSIPIDGGPYKQVTKKTALKFSYSFSRDRNIIVYVSSDYYKPYEIYTENLRTGKIKQVTQVNDHLPKLPFARCETVRWKSFDGVEIEGILTYPLHYEKGKRYPLVLELHGGPTGVWWREFSAAYVKSQVFAGRGIAVLQPNVRGSNGRGKEFRFLNLKELGGNDVKDALAGVDYLIEKGLADPERLGVHGWSYGGYLTAMVMGRTQRFKAAATIAGDKDLISSFGTTRSVGLIANFFGCEIWECPELWTDRSPVFHVDKMTTPLLQIYGDYDPYNSKYQGYELYRCLERKGVETELVIYPRSGHGPGEPKFELDMWQRIFDWINNRINKN